ncbi:MAG TPA: DUF3072 domain-containing protein [Candidatus Limnocylindrales bacterium]|jgi:hypothetical protein|nr:DUF3072 domain-containing protein [Candidatus Limnocylindrales bacterium]
MRERTDRDDMPQQPDLDPESRPGLEKDPSDWVTGEEPMTGAQASYLENLSRQTGEDVRGDLTKAEASEKIDELRDRAGLGNRKGNTIGR